MQVLFNTYSILAEDTYTFFPTLESSNKRYRQPSGNNSNKAINNYAESVGFIHAKTSYSKVNKISKNRIREQENSRKNMREYTDALEEGEVFSAPNESQIRKTIRSIRC